MPENARSLAEFARTIPGVRLTGLMTMGPVTPDPDACRPYFALTRELYEQFCKENLFECDAPVLSMGMSDSYVEAIEEGATLVRVGSALFGARNYR